MTFPAWKAISACWPDMRLSWRQSRRHPDLTSGGTREKAIVLGGLAEVSEDRLTVLANVATSLQDVDRAQLAETIAEMGAKLAEKKGGELGRAISS